MNTRFFCVLMQSPGMTGNAPFYIACDLSRHLSRLGLHVAAVCFMLCRGCYECNAGAGMASANVRLKKSGDTFRPCWYGRFDEDGREREINLNVPWAGTAPVSGCLRDPGNAAFEASRHKAEAALRSYVEELRRKGRADHLTERLIESKTGRAVEYVRLDELPDRWRRIARTTPPAPEHLDGCAAVFTAFTAFMHQRKRKAVFLHEVTADDAAAWLADLQGRYTRKTCRDQFGLLRSAFSRMLPHGSVSPFPRLVSKVSDGDTGGTIHRKPFTLDELRLLLDAARADPFLYPLVTCAACTGMRRGDVCNLRWDAVDLEAGMLAVKTSKTGETVEIPIFAPLRAVLEAVPKTARKEYVFPDARAMLLVNSPGLSTRFKRLVTRALAGMSAPAADGTPPANAPLCAGDVAAIKKALPDGERRWRVLDVFTRHIEGKGYKVIARETGIPLGTVSEYVRNAAAITGRRYQRPAADPITRADIRQATQAQRTIGRAASVRDWHALRATWVTLALSAGVPMELVRRVTGHKTVEIVLQHYFKPDREQFRAALTGAMPDVLTGGARAVPTPAAELATLAGKVAAGTATDADKKRLRKLAREV
jgi:integrase